MKADDLGHLFVVELLPNETDLGETSAEILQNLEQKYGTPQIIEEGDDKKHVYESDDSNLVLIVNRLSGYITGGETTLKQMAPCTPVRINPVFAGAGTGTATVSIILGAALPTATAAALGQAAINALLNLNALKGRICGAAPCAAGCTCTQNFTFTPPIVTPTTNYFLGIIPVSVTVTVSLPYGGSFWCL